MARRTKRKRRRKSKRNKPKPLPQRQFRILGVDPGKRNTWAVCYDQVGDTKRLKQKGFRHLDLLPDNKIDERMPEVRRRVVRLLAMWWPDLVVIERFVQRRGGRGNSAEHINLLAGIMFDVCQYLGIRLMLVMSSQHKIWLTKKYGKNPQEKWPKLNEHAADASSLALYGFHQVCSEEEN